MLLPFFVGVFCSFAYAYDFPGILVEKKKQWDRLVVFVGEHHSGRVRTLWYSAKIVWELGYLSVSQYLNSSVKKNGPKSYILSYTIEGRIYKYIVRPKRGPSSIEFVLDERGHDVTESILPYWGPSRDWHGQVYTPILLGYRELTFKMRNSERYVYSTHQPIRLSGA